MQTILGAGGAIGHELARALLPYTTDIRLVGRNPKKVNDTNTLHVADLTDPAQVDAAVAGSEVCYLTIGLPYNTTLWEAQWPSLIKNVVAACIRHQSKLVFFDNVYAIGGDQVQHITESSPISPTSKKGKVRAQVDAFLLEQIEAQTLPVIIARSPDFFSTYRQQSILMNLVYDNLIKGKAAQWFCNADVPHAFGYTPDLAKGTALLGNTPEAFNQIWNLPVDKAALTGRQWTHLFATIMNKPDKITVLPAWGLKALGLFIPILRELYEMRYQYDRPYYFDASKFLNAFPFTPISNEDAVRETVDALAAEQKKSEA